MKIAAFTKYDRLAASTRQRLLQYVPHLEAAGFEVDHKPLLDDRYVRSLATGEPYPKMDIARAYARRFRELVGGVDADLVWVYAELFPYLPASAERLAFAAGKPVIYDFDDAFFHQYDDHPRVLARGFLSGKLRPLMRGAAACTCGNEYLRDYAAPLCKRSLIFPTVVDTGAYRPAAREASIGPPVIGWIGSPSTWRYVRPLLPMFRRLAESGRAVFRAVGAGAEAVVDAFPGLDLVEWNEASEIAEVQRMDIGIMPLPDEPWARGKSGYKLIQYGACGVPVLASPVGVNSEIVVDGSTGFLALGVDDWQCCLDRLLSDPSLRQEMGRAGRKRIKDRYSLGVHAPRLVDLLRSLTLPLRESEQS